MPDATLLSSPVANFAQILQHADAGKFADVLDEKLKEAIKESRKNGGKSKLCVTVTIKANKRDDNVVITTCDATLKTSLPQAEREEAKFFVDAGGDLTRRDPKQKEMFEDREERAARKA